jgi:hypothetical protein
MTAHEKWNPISAVSLRNPIAHNRKEYRFDYAQFAIRESADG